MSDETGFDVMEPVHIGDLSDVKEDRQVIPAINGIKVRIVKAANRVNKEGSVKSISMQLNLVDGIDETGKYRNKAVFVDVPYWADLSVKTSPYYEKKQHLLLMQSLIKALHLGDVTVNDQLLSDLKMQEVRANIIVKKDQAFNSATGKWEDTGGFRNTIKVFLPTA